jgi:hypothetical protein
MDVLGAGLGGGSSLLDNYLNGNSLNWKSAAAWGLGGAVCGSLGVRLGRGPVCAPSTIPNQVN